MTLVDTTVWIDFFAGRSTLQTDVLEKYVSDQDICICGVILTEVLQGIRSEKEYNTTQKYFDFLLFLPMTQSTFVRAAEIYRCLRQKGITVRKPIDCMIAAVAIEHKVPLLHSDKDFNPIEEHCCLKTIRKIRT